MPAASDSDYAQYEYYPNGMLKRITYPKLNDGSHLTSEFVYDGVNRLLSVNNKKGTQLLSSYSYSHDANGNIISQTSAAGTTNYTYDSLDRLSTIQYPGGASVQYTYDMRGNRKTETTSTSPFHYEEIDYTYNVWDQLTSVEKNGATTTFEYEPQGLRIKKSSPEKTVRYTYDNNGRVIAESNASFVVQANYVWGPDRLLQKRDTSTNDKYYYLYNGHGDVVQIVNQSGQIVNEYHYDEWGNIIDQQETIHNPFKYSGEIYDDETGLYYLRARYYDPSMGRFINKDTYEGDITNPLSLNLYTYVHNNPLIYTDPSGHKVWLIHGTNIMKVDNPEDTWKNDFVKYVEKLFNESSAKLRWTGGNSTGARLKAAEEFAEDIYKWHTENPNEPIRLVGHSHGGNVSIMIANLLDKKGMKVDTLITIATPVREYKLKTDVGQHIQLYNTGDSIQKNGGSIWNAGVAGRKFEGAENVKVNISIWRSIGGRPIDSHSIMHSNIEIWKKYLEPLLK